jgi:hypothetical protein
MGEGLGRVRDWRHLYSNWRLWRQRDGVVSRLRGARHDGPNEMVAASVDGFDDWLRYDAVIQRLACLHDAVGE